MSFDQENPFADLPEAQDPFADLPNAKQGGLAKAFGAGVDKVQEIGYRAVKGFTDVGEDPNSYPDGSIGRSVASTLGQGGSLSRFADKGIARNIEEQREYQPTVPSYTDIDSIGDAGSYIGELTAGSIPYMAAALYPPAFAAMGGGLSNEAYETQEDKDPVKAVASGFGQIALEKVGALGSLGRLTSAPRKTLTDKAKGLAYGALGEGATEAGQDALAQWGGGTKLEDIDTDSLAESFVGGAAVGGTIRGGTEAVDGLVSKMRPKLDPNETTDLFEDINSPVQQTAGNETVDYDPTVRPGPVAVQEGQGAQDWQPNWQFGQNDMPYRGQIQPYVYEGEVDPFQDTPDSVPVGQVLDAPVIDGEFERPKGLPDRSGVIYAPDNSQDFSGEVYDRVDSESIEGSGIDQSGGAGIAQPGGERETGILRVGDTPPVNEFDSSENPSMADGSGGNDNAINRKYDINYNLPRNTVVGTPEDIAELAKKPNRIKQKKIRFAVAMGDQAKEISQVAGVDVDGYKHVVDTSSLRHAFTKHGSKGTELSRGQVPIVESDFEKVGEIVTNPDSVINVGKDKKGLDLIRYEKELDGTFYYVEEVRNKRQELAFKTMWKARTRDQMLSKTPPRLTSETVRQQPSTVKSIADINTVANEAATSPLNKIPEPTAAQKEAGNYKKGHIKLHGMDIAIENPKGSERTGVDEGGKEWRNKINHHYGYVKRTEGADGDHIDVFIGDKPESQKVFVVDQVNPKTGEFDEVKAMIGFDTIDDAKAGYLSNYDRNWKGLSEITETTTDEFKAWTQKPRKSKQPFARPKVMEPQPTDSKGSAISYNDLGDIKVFQVEESERDPGNVQSERGGKGDVLQGPKLNLLAHAPVQREIARQQYSDNFNVKYSSIAEKEIATGIDRVWTPEEAAHIFSAIRKDAQESFNILVTDKNGKTLEVIRHTKGLKGSSTVDPLTVVGSIASVEGAANVWFGHNHPSGTTTPSGSDYNITDKLKDAMDGMGVNYKGHVIVGGGRKAAYFLNGSSTTNEIFIKPAIRDKKIPLTGRVRRKWKMQDAPQVTSPESARKVVESINAENAVILLSGQYQLVGSLAMSENEMMTLRSGGRVNRILSALNETNASAVILKTNNQESAGNISKFINRFDGSVQVLDWLSGDNYRVSDAERGGVTIGSSGVFYNRSKSPIIGNGVTEKSAKLAFKRFKEQFKGIDDAGFDDIITDKKPSEIFGPSVAADDNIIKGAFDKSTNRLFVFSQNHASIDDIRRTLREELLTHKGLGVFEEQEISELLDRINNTRESDNKDIQAIWADIEKNYADSPPIIQAEEFLGKVSQDEITIPGKYWHRIVASLQKLLRKFGLVKDTITVSEMRTVVAEISDRLQSGQEARNYKYDSQEAADSGLFFNRGGTETIVEQFELPEETKPERLIRFVQDKFNRVKRAQQSIKSAGGIISDDADVYGKEALYYGKVEEDFRQLAQNHIEPLAELLSKAKIDQKEFDLYLYALHAPERNAHIKSMDEGMTAGSGMTDQEAAAIIARVNADPRRRAFKEANTLVRDMIDQRVERMREDGLIDEETYGSLQDSYTNYVPLKGQAKDEGGKPQGTGMGFNIKGGETIAALGRKSKAESPLLHSFIDTQRAIVRGHKNAVGNAMLNLINEAPNESLWNAYTTEGPLERKKGRDGKIQMLPMSEEKMSALASSPASEWVATKRDGVAHYMKFEDPLIAQQMKNFGVDNGNKITQMLGSVNRFLSMMSTSANPEFLITNVIRDVQTAVFNVAAESEIADGKLRGLDAKAFAKEAFASLPKAFGGIRKALRDNDTSGEWGQIFDDFRKQGAKTGYFDMKDLETQSKDLKKLMLMQDKKSLIKFKDKAFKFIEDYNSSVENAVRLSVYKVAIDKGVSRHTAAVLAKNLTVNFNRKGEAGTWLNSLYLFANAGIQGTANFARAIGTFKVDGDGKKKLNLAQKAGIAMAGIAFSAAMLNRMIADDDDDGESFWDKIPDHVKERNLILMIGGKDYVTVPLPYGYNIFANFGTAAESVINGGKISDNAGFLARATMGSFLPLGLSEGNDGLETTIKTVMPQIGKPLIDLATNTNFFGSRIYNDSNEVFGDKRSDAGSGYDKTNQFFKSVAMGLNQMTGGTEYQSGTVDIHPETVRYLAEYIGGGAGRFALQSSETLARAAKGEFEPTRTPFVRRAYGEVNDYGDQTAFYENLDKVETIRAEFKSLKGPAKLKFHKENGDILRITEFANNTKKYLSAMRKRKMALESRGMKDQVEKLDAMMEARIDRFNKRYNEIMEKR